MEVKNINSSQSARRKILFFAEAVTLAHVVRPVVLAQTLNRKKYDIYFAWDDRFKNLFPNLDFTFHHIDTITTSSFLRSLKKGSPVYDENTLERYIQEDLRIINNVTPDIIIGDFRLSLAISAELSGIPYITISNIYWSPYIKTQYPIPEHPLVKLFGVSVAQNIFNFNRPLIFAYHCLPINKVRKRYGLSSLGHDLRKVYTYADYTLYADIAELFCLSPLPNGHHIIGPILWSPAIVTPSWWHELTHEKPIVYLNLGSSGAINILPNLLNVLAGLPITVIAATAGRKSINEIPDNAYVTEFIPGNDACDIASVVVCNGGSPTTQQALSSGKPVLGIASNMDQHLNMNNLECAGVGVTMRTDRFNLKTFRSNIEKLLDDKQYANNANSIAKIYKKYNSLKSFKTIIKDI